MDPEDLLDQEVEELPGLEGHATANMDVLKALDTLDVSYRYVIQYSRMRLMEGVIDIEHRICFCNAFGANIEYSS